MDKGEIKEKLRELADHRDEGAILPQTLLAIMEAEEESAERVATMSNEINKQIADNAAKIDERIDSLEKSLKSETANIQKKQSDNSAILIQKHSHGIYLSIAILIIILGTVAIFGWMNL